MHTEILTAPQLAVLERLKAIPAVREFYLAGGTALALRHGHRRSIDFDFFRPTPFNENSLATALEQTSDTLAMSSASAFRRRFAARQPAWVTDRVSSQC